jgi:hypothetical protein
MTRAAHRRSKYAADWMAGNLIAKSFFAKEYWFFVIDSCVSDSPSLNQSNSFAVLKRPD